MVAISLHTIVRRSTLLHSWRRRGMLFMCPWTIVFPSSMRSWLWQGVTKKSSCEKISQQEWQVEKTFLFTSILIWT